MEPASTRKRPRKGHADYLWALSVSARGRVRAPACVCLLEGAGSAGGRSLTNIGFAHWHQPPITFFHTRLASLRLGSPPTHSCVQERNPHAFLDPVFRILMPELILFLALLSGSLRDLLCVDERLRRRAERICKVSLKGTEGACKQCVFELDVEAGTRPGSRWVQPAWMRAPFPRCWPASPVSLRRGRSVRLLRCWPGNPQAAGHPSSSGRDTLWVLLKPENGASVSLPGQAKGSYYFT